MSDFLGNLAARAVAPSNAIRPRLPSRFESPATAERTALDAEQEPSADAARIEDRGRVSQIPFAPTPSPTMRERSIEIARPIVAAEPAASVVSPPVNVPLADPPPFVAPITPTKPQPPEKGIQPAPTPLLAPVPTLPVRPVLLSQETPIPATRSSRPPEPVTPREAGETPPRKRVEPVVPQRIVAVEKPPVAAAVASSPEATGAACETPAETAAPIIRVTIGRIDVRAVLPSAPAPTRKAPTASPVLSLDEYLKQRDGGQR